MTTGFSVLLQKEFRSNVVLVFTGAVKARRGISGFRSGFSRFEPGELTVDDSDEAHPVYFFETFCGREVQLAGSPFRVIITFYGVDDDDHPELVRLTRAGHEFIYVTDLAGPEAEARVTEFARQVPEARRSQVHLFSTSTMAASKVMRAVENDIVAKAVF